MDEVFADVEQTLKQMMGGQLVTLEQAATDQGAAAQMTKQVQMLTSGPLKIAGSEAEAFKILEAFSKGGMPSMEDVKGKPEDVLADTVKTGNQIQEHQLDALNVVRNEAEKQSVIAAFSLDSLRKIATGKESTLGQKILRQRPGMETKAARRKVIEQVPTTSLSKELARTAEGIKSIGKAAGDKVKGMVGGKEGPAEPGAKPAGTGKAAEGATPLGAVTPAYDEDLIALGEGPAKDVAAGAAFVDAAGAKQEPDLSGRPGEPSTIIIKVMGQNDVEKMIEVKLDEYGKIVGHKEVAGKYGQ
jgi:hypothetical protein